MKRELLVFGFLLALTGKAANSSTIALPYAEYTASFAIPPDPGITKSQNVPIDNTWGNSMTSATTIANPQMVSVVGSATSCCSFLPSGMAFNARASASYVVYIDPSGEAPRDISEVPIIVSAGVRADCSSFINAATAAQATGTATVLIGSSPALTAVCSDRNAHGADFEDTTELFPISTFVPVTVFAGATVSAASELFLTATASVDVWADPTFQIDPSFPFGSDYQILISPSGVSSGGSDVPEPVSFISVVLGLAGIGLKRRLKNSAHH